MLKINQTIVLAFVLYLFQPLLYAQEHVIHINATATVEEQDVLKNIALKKGDDLFIAIYTSDPKPAKWTFFSDKFTSAELKGVNDASEEREDTVLLNLKPLTEKILSLKNFAYEIRYSGEAGLALLNEEKKYVGSIKLIEKKDLKEDTLDISTLAFPSFPQRALSNREDCHQNSRFLLIDADPLSSATSVLYKCNGKSHEKSENADTSQKEVLANASITADNDWFHNKRKTSYLTNQTSLKVVLRNYALLGDRKLSVRLNSVDFSYEKSIRDLYESVGSQEDETGDGTDSIVEDGIKANRGKSEEKAEKSAISAYLKQAFDAIKSKGAWSLSEMDVLRAYKHNLKASMRKAIKDGMSFSLTDLELYSTILNWYPEFLIVHELPLHIEDADRVEVQVQFEEEGSTSLQTVANYWVSGGIKPSISTNFFLSGLSNNGVFTDSIPTANGNELRAFMDSTNTMSVGIGVSGEMAWRTAGYVRPTLNLGFFIPFEEDITAFGTIGIGPSIATENLKFSLSVGAAFGKVNTINARYVDRNLADFPNLTNEGLTAQSWDWSWQVGIGFSYNL